MAITPKDNRTRAGFLQKTALLDKSFDSLRSCLGDMSDSLNPRIKKKLLISSFIQLLTINTHMNLFKSCFFLEMILYRTHIFFYILIPWLSSLLRVLSDFPTFILLPGVPVTKKLNTLDSWDSPWLLTATSLMSYMVSLVSPSMAYQQLWVRGPVYVTTWARWRRVGLVSQITIFLSQSLSGEANWS